MPEEIFLPVVATPDMAQPTFDMVRMVSVYDIDFPLADIVLERMVRLAKQDNRQPITVRFHSDGGSIVEAMAVADTINYIRGMGPRIDGWVSSHCMSSAVFILQFCDRRVASSHSTLMVHGGTFGLHNVDNRRTKSELAWVKALDEAVLEVYTRRTHKSREFWEELLEDNNPTYLTAEQALEWGLLDSVVPTWEAK